MRSSKIEGYQYIKGVPIYVERGTAKNCSLCQRQFALLTKEHQCKRCLRAVCDKCSPTKGIAYEDNKMHRQCNLCKDEIERLQRFIEEYKICFMVDTLSLEWLKAFGITLKQAKNEFYEEQLHSKQAEDLSEYNSYKSQIGAVFKEIQIGQNYSLREFFIMCLKKNSKERVFESVEQVLDVFLKKYPETGYQPDLVMITMFFLFFASVPTTYILLKVLYHKILPAHLWNRALRFKRYDFGEEIQNVMNVNNKLSKPVSEEFLENRIYRYIQTLTINLLLFETTFHIINDMFISSEPYSAFIRQLSLTLSMTNNDIVQMGSNYQLGEIIVLRGTQASKLQNMLMKTRSMSITLNDYYQNSLKKDSGDDLNHSIVLKDSMIFSLKNEMSQTKVTTEALLHQIETLKQQVASQEEVIEHQNQELERQDEMITQLEEKNKQLIELTPGSDILEQMLKLKQFENQNGTLQKMVEELQTNLIHNQEQNAIYYKEIEQQKQQINDIKKMQYKYNSTINITEDPIFQQDIRDLEIGLDGVQKKLLRGFVDMITQLQTELKYKELELQLRRDEVILNPVIEQLKKEMCDLEDELNQANLQIIEQKKQINRLSIQTTIKKQDYQQDQQMGCSPNKDCKIY